MQYFGFDRPPFGFKTFGFGESKLQADFTTGTYKASGEAKAFADLFTFTRAGKAWLVKDGGLVEYAMDVPRLDNGLLIEQSATNVMTGTYPLVSTIAPNENGSYSSVSISDVPRFGGSSYSSGVEHHVSYYIKANGASVLSSLSRVLENRLGLKDNSEVYYAGLNLSNIDATKERKSMIVDLTTYSGALQITASVVSPLGTGYGSAIIGEFFFKYPQVTRDLKISSFIPTEATPVTRPADFLTSKITGTTVTGDWDGTLTLSIVAGQLVHSGYGRIRSLEIN